MVRVAPLQEEDRVGARERQGALEVQVELGGLELDWWPET